MALSHHTADPDLIRAARDGDRSAVDVLVRRHDPWVRQVAYATIGNRAAVDDIAQNVWTNVWQRLETLSDPQGWRGWLYKLTRNAALDSGRQLARDKRLTLALPDMAPDSAEQASNPARQLAETEENQRMLRAIHGLPALYREPFVLRHLRDCSYAEIAETLDLPVATVETRLVRARRLLREALADKKAN